MLNIKQKFSTLQNVKNINFLHYLFLCVFSLLILLPGLNSIPVIDRDEAHFAQATRQMLQTGNYGQIRFQDTTRFQKPPGINWLQAISVKLFSCEDANVIWPYRLPSILCALLSVFFTFYLGKLLFNPKVAFLGSIFLASSLLFVIEAHMAVIDSALLFSVMLMQCSLWKIFDSYFSKSQLNQIWIFLFWFAMSFGFLLKGVTPLIAILTITTISLIERNYKWLKSLKPIAGLMFFSFFTLLWVYVVNQAENTNYLMQMFNKDLLPKLKGGHESHGKPPFFHLAILFFTFWPAILFFPQGFKYAFQQRKDKAVYFLLAWIIPTWIFFEVMPTKLPQYVLPTFPAIALICANIKNINFKKINFRGFLFLFSLLMYPIVFTMILPNIEQLWLTKKINNVIEEKNYGNLHLTVLGFAEPSLVFYRNTKNITFTNANDLSSYNADLLLIEKNRFKSFNREDFVILDEIKGFNYSKGKWTELVLTQYAKKT